MHSNMQNLNIKLPTQFAFKEGQLYTITFL